MEFQAGLGVLEPLPFSRRFSILGITPPKISEVSNFRRRNVLVLFCWHILEKFKENPRNGFSAKPQKLPKMAFFRTNERFSRNGQKSQKSVRATFLTFFTPNFVPGFGKILGAVSEIIRYRQTHKHTDRSDFIGSSRFSTGNQKVQEDGNT